MRNTASTIGILKSALPAALGSAALLFGLGAALPARADDPPQPANPAPPPNGGHDHRNDPAWQACKKQADDQNLERGEARRAFMKNCLKSAQGTSPPPPAS
jgi:hypothetical protein